MMTTMVIDIEHGELAKKFMGAVGKYLIHHATRQYWAFIDIITVLDMIESGELPGTYNWGFYERRMNELRAPDCQERCVFERLVGFIKSEWSTLSADQQSRAQKFELHS